MVPWRELGRARVAAPGHGDMVLARRGDEFAIRVGGAELMNSRQHHSEDQLGALACKGLARVANARVLVGGLGMGFTARAALDVLRDDARVTIAELVPEVVAWNRDHLADLARRPLDDARVEVRIGSVAAAIADGGWHAIILDVDNGPDAFTTPANSALYGAKGLAAIRRALVRGGTLGVWSVADDRAFTERLRRAGFEVERHRVPARPGANVKHVLWIAR